MRSPNSGAAWPRPPPPTYGVAWRTAHAADVAHVADHLAPPIPSVAVLGIDETRRGKPVWRREETTGRWVLAADRWHTGFVDADGTGGLLAQVEGRSAAAVTTWLNDQPPAWRQAITHVTIDLSASYAKAVREALPHAVLVADRFHLVRLGNEAVTDVRQRVVREHEGRRGRTVDPAWQARRRLLTGHERLRPQAFERMWNSLVDTGDPGWEILGAYVVKESLRALLALAGTDPDRHVIRARLHEFYHRAAANPAPEAHRLTKHEGRNAFGFRNPVTSAAAYAGPAPPPPAGDRQDHRDARPSAMSRFSHGSCGARAPLGQARDRAEGSTWFRSAS